MRIGQKLSIPIAMVALGNVVNGIERKEDSLYFLFFALIFIPIISIFLLYKREVPKRVMSYVLLFLSLVGLLFGGDSTLVGVTLLCDSIFISRNKKAITYYTAIAVVIVIIQTTMIGLNPAQLLVYAGGGSFLFVLFEHYIHPKKVDETFRIVQKDENGSQINAEVAKILSLRSKGYDWPEINDKLELNISDEWCRKKVTAEAKRLGYKNKDEFLLNLSLYGK